MTQIDQKIKRITISRNNQRRTVKCKSFQSTVAKSVEQDHVMKWLSHISAAVAMSVDQAHAMQRLRVTFPCL